MIKVVENNQFRYQRKENKCKIFNKSTNTGNDLYGDDISNQFWINDKDRIGFTPEGSALQIRLRINYTNSDYELLGLRYKKYEVLGFEVRDNIHKCGREGEMDKMKGYWTHPDSPFAMGQFIYSKLNSYISPEKSLIVDCASETYTRLNPGKRSGYNTFGIDLVQKSADLNKNFFEVEKSDINLSVSNYLIIANPPGRAGTGDNWRGAKGAKTRIHGLVKIVELFGKDVPIAFMTSSMFRMYQLPNPKYPNQHKYDSVLPKISAIIKLPASVSFQRNYHNELVLFNIDYKGNDKGDEVCDRYELEWRHKSNHYKNYDRQQLQ